MKKLGRTGVVVMLLLLAASARAQNRADDEASVLRMPQAEFKKLLEAGQLTAIDVRDTDSYKAGHIPGAVSMPFGLIDRYVDELKKAKRPIVAYCA